MVKYLKSLHSCVIQDHSECHIFEAVPSCSGGKSFQELSSSGTFLILYYYYGSIPLEPHSTTIYTEADLEGAVSGVAPPPQMVRVTT